MEKVDLYNIYLNMEQEDIILSFKGDISKDLLSSVYQIVEARMESDNEDPKRKKKLFQVLVECLQNLYNHMESFQVGMGDGATDHTGSAIFMVGRTKDGGYRIATGNYVLNSNADALKDRIDKINAMTPAELKAYYLERLGASELSEKGGAGLGIIEIARKSGNTMDYNFQKTSDKYSFFTLTVKIN
jgi:Family of unknown function (DUF6272)